MMFVAILNFILGFLLGISLPVLAILWFSRSLLKKQLNKATSSARSAIKSTSNKEGDAMMDKVRELTLEQLEIRGQLDQPQKNALHGKHKNSLTARIKELEEQKTDLLRKTLALGYDPMIGTIDENGEIQKMKLSKYMAEYDLLEKEEPPKSPPPKKENPFKVIEGGKGSDPIVDKSNEADNDNNSDK